MKILRLGAVVALLLVGGGAVWNVLMVPWRQARARSSFAHDAGPVRPLWFEEVARLDEALRETSGLAVSRSHAGVLGPHTDSGDGPRIYAMDSDGHHHAIIELSEATSVDWEAMDLGP
ncbi:MAG: hypothetical protein P8170_18870, partial [Gemmatimonadota bacterium]